MSRRFPLPPALLLSALIVAAAAHGGLTANLHSEYFNIARALVAGDGFANAVGPPTGPTAWMPPLLPALQAALLWAGGRDAVAAGLVVLHTAALIVTGLLVLALAQRTTRTVGPWAAAAVFSLALLYHYWFWFQMAHDCWVSLLALDLLLVGLCWLRPLDGWRRAAGWGLFGGLCALAHPVVAFVWGVLSALLGLRQRTWSRLAVAFLGAAVTLGPWAVRNYAVFHRFIPVKSNLAYELYQSQCLQPDGLLQQTAWLSHPSNAGNPQQQEYRHLGEAAYLDRKWHQFSESVRADPADFVDRLATRLVGATVWYVPFNRRLEAKKPWLLWARRLTHPLPFVALLILVFSGLREPLGWPQWAVIGAYLLYLLPYVAASYYERYTVPLLAVRALLVLWAVDRLLTFWPPFRERRP